MRVLLLGGTGAMGSYLSRLLSEKGNKVVVTSRTRQETNELFEYRQGNAKDLLFLTEILQEKWDSIVDFMVYSEDEFLNRISLILDFTNQYIFLSSARVYNDSQDAITEGSARLIDSSIDKEFLATSEYSLAKARQENILQLHNKKNWTIVRPYITYSDKRLQLGTLEKENWLYRAIHGRTIVFSEDINNHFTTLTLGLDVATGILSLINNQNTLGEVYHITNDQATKWSAILDLYLNVMEKQLGYRPKVIYQNLEDFLTWNPGKYQIIYDRLYNRKFDNTKINKFLDTTQFAELQVGLKDCLNTFLSNPKFLDINWKFEAIKDKFTKERTPLYEINGFKNKVKYILYRYFINTK